MLYFDAAATTLEKPEAVGRAMLQACREMTSPGRGGHSAARLAEETAFTCRTEAGALFGAAPEQVIFTANATHALNIAINTLVHPGSRVVVSGYEHNAVMRPLYAIPGVQITIASAPLFAPQETVAAFEQALTQGADAVIVNHVSNVFGAIQPVDEIAALCRRYGVPLVVDASQSAGFLPIELNGLGAAFVAMPGHKGLYGPQGTGLLLCGIPGRPLLFGGTGSASLDRGMPESLPDRLEAGTHNMPGIAGLLEGIRFVRKTGIRRIAEHERAVIRRIVKRLASWERIRVFAAEDPQRQGSVLSFTAEGMDSERVASALARHGVAVRAGVHCAPLAHQTAGTLPDGTVRISVSAFSTVPNADRLCGILWQILHENVTD